ncbi:MAG: peptidylprolyl isomerase [Terriglobales bacterium]
MRAAWIGCLLIGITVWAQQAPTTTAAATNSSLEVHKQGDDALKPHSAADVAADDPVLTIKGLCPRLASAAEADQAKSACQTVVTRAQFEKLMDALRIGEDAETKHHLAKAYPQFLVLAHEAEQRSLDKQPRFEERLAFARLQILSQELMGQFEQEAARVPATDIEDYYKKNISAFELASVERIVIPIRSLLNQPGTDQGKSDQDVMTKEAELLRIQAVAGEDFGKLQKQAYDTAGVSGDNPPNPNMDKIRREGLPPAHASVFDLKPGQVSRVISDATGHYIYKLDWKGVESLDAVRSEINNALRAERLRKMVQSVEQPFTTEINEGYFATDGSSESD